MRSFVKWLSIVLLKYTVDAPYAEKFVKAAILVKINVNVISITAPYRRNTFLSVVVVVVDPSTTSDVIVRERYVPCSATYVNTS